MSCDASRIFTCKVCHVIHIVRCKSHLHMQDVSCNPWYVMQQEGFGSLTLTEGARLGKDVGEARCNTTTTTSSNSNNNNSSSNNNNSNGNGNNNKRLVVAVVLQKTGGVRNCVSND